MTVFNEPARNRRNIVPFKADRNAAVVTLNLLMFHCFDLSVQKVLRADVK